MATVSDEPREVSRELREAVRCSQWGEVTSLIHSPDCPDDHRLWAIDKTVQQAPERSVEDVLQLLVDDQLDNVLRCLLSRRLWRCVGRVLQREVSPALHRWAVEEGVTYADWSDFTKHILPCCSSEERELVLAFLMSRHLWKPVGVVLKLGVSAEQQQWAVEQASRHVSPAEFHEHILPHCTEKDLELALTHLVSRGLWESVDKVLSRGVGATHHKRAVVSAVRHADESHFTDYIFHHCTEEELEVLYMNRVSRGRWDLADRVTHGEITVTEHILSQLVSQRQWESVGKFLRRGIRGAQRRWAVKQACIRAGHFSFIQYILPECNEEELEIALTCFVSRSRWASVHAVLRQSRTSLQHRCIIEQAISLTCDDFNTFSHIAHHCTEKDLTQVMAYMVSQGLLKPLKGAVNTTEWMLSHLVSQGLWDSVGWFLQQNDISCEQHSWAVEQANKYASDCDFVFHILPRCHDEELEHVSINPVSQGVWTKVGEMLEEGHLTSKQQRWAMEQASKHACDCEFCSCILPCCHDDDLESIITRLISRGLWMSFGRVIKRGVPSVQRRLLIEQTIKHTPDYINIICHIVPCCTEEELTLVVAHMVSQGLMEPLRHGVIAREGILSHLMSHGLWRSVGRFLQPDMSDEQCRWTWEQAWRPATYFDFVHYILPQCHVEKLKSELIYIVSTGAWKKDVSTAKDGLKVVEVSAEQGASTVQDDSTVVEATKHLKNTASSPHILRCCSEDDILAELTLSVANKNWKQTQNVLYENVCDTLYTWVVSGPDSPPHDTLFWKIVQHCHIEVSLALDLVKAVAPKTCVFYDDTIVKISSDLAKYVSWQRPLCEALMTALLHTLCYVMCSDDRDYTHTIRHTKDCVSDIYTNITDCIRDNTDSLQGNTLKTIQKKGKWTSVFTEIADTHKLDPLFLLHFLRGLNLYRSCRQGKKDDDILLAVLAVFPLFPQLQSVALRMMLRKQRWDVLSQACLSHVWEQDQRLLFRAAVMQGQWDVVRQWCDHTVHDDQRHWALTEAFKEKQWEVVLLLADHGLTPAEQMHAHYIVAKHGDWDTVLHMVERGGDITEVSDLLENWVSGNLRKKPEEDTTAYEERCMKLIRLRLRFAKNSALSPKKALERCQWGSVLFNILHKPKDGYFTQVLDKVRKEKAWHILMHLVRLGMSRAKRNTLFPQMVEEQRWGVCRMLLQYGVDVDLCMEALPELLGRNQWTLVAMVMEYDVDNAVRRQVMWYAFQRRAGALFWHCLTITQEKEHMPVDSRRKLFHQAISRDIWQAVKPFIEDKDDTGIRNRDTAFLEAIEQHLWDVVDYCQLHGADINMKDENGETPLHREARKREWKAVKEIVLRDAQPNLLDKDGVCVLNRLIDNKQWEVVKTVIVYGGDIHLQAKFSEYNSWKTHTPLQALIDVRQADIIKFSILWCGGQKEGVNNKGETVFHAVCDSDRWDAMEDLIARKVDPLAVTRTGKSPLVYAVLNSKCPQRMVTECSRAGFSLYQPLVTGPQDAVPDAITHGALAIWKCDIYSVGDDMLWNTKITSPLVCAVLRDMADLVLMLYDSGSCSSSELLTLCAQLPKLIKPGTEENRKLQEEFRRREDMMLRDSLVWTGQHRRQWMQYYHRLTHVIEKHTAFLTKLASTPRTLLSSCRLRISRHLHFTDTYRQVFMDDFPLPLVMKNYLNYSDFLDPGYGQHVGLPPKEGREQ